MNFLSRIVPRTKIHQYQSNTVSLPVLSMHVFRSPSEAFIHAAEKETPQTQASRGLGVVGRTEAQINFEGSVLGYQRKNPREVYHSHIDKICLVMHSTFWMFSLFFFFPFFSITHVKASKQ